MAAWRTRALVLPLLTVHITWLLPQDPPPNCLIPYFDEENNIHCHWAESFNHLVPSNFTLHWTTDVEHGYSGLLEVGESESGIIPRAAYLTHEYIKVWVSAANSLGEIDSEMLITNIESIIQPASPSITGNSGEPLEINWAMSEAEYFGHWHCKVQYKKQCDQDWTEVEDSYEVSFILEDAVPFTTYKFRVRCKRAYDESAVMSDWSSEYIAETPPAAPMGILDVWSDCDSAYESCNILWKEMPKQQARSNINSYVLTMKLNNGSMLKVNGSENMFSETCGQCGPNMIRNKTTNLVSDAQQSYLSCPQEQSCFHYCHLSVPVNEVKDIGVCADTEGGKSSPALVALPTTGLLQPAMFLNVIGKSQELNVSWSLPALYFDSIQEYVVQHKPIGLPHTPCLKWVKVHKNQTSVLLRGQLSNYTAYNISLFAIVNSSSYLLKSAIAYTVEGVPPKVTDLRAIPISPVSVKLTWTPIPLNKSKGHVLQYHVGFYNDGVVFNVSKDQSSFQRSDLNPDQQYEVWIRAKTSAGVGQMATASFTTISSGNYSKIVIIVIACGFLLFLAILIMRCLWDIVDKWINRTPDPINSNSFKQMSNQFLHPWPFSSPSMECGLIIAQVEIVLKPDVDHEPEMELPEEHREERPIRGKVLQGYGELDWNNSTLPHQKGYSQMIDSSDEERREDEYEYEDGEWNEQPFPSDYEKHFLPCIVDA